jgi:branched-chain amino acid transport system substrate-binding protein
MKGVRSWKLVLPLAALVAVASVWVSGSVAAPGGTSPVRVAIMTDCKGAFGFGYELDIGGAQAAMYEYAGAQPKNKQKPSAGMTGGTVAGRDLTIVGYGCGDDTAATALRETRRLMEQLDADIMLGPLSGDEAVAVANYAKDNPDKTFIIGTAGSQDPTLQIAPENVFRYHGDGAQWNAGLGEIVYKRLGWRTAAIIMDDYSFGWTSGAGIIADFCGVGGEITKRVFPPLNTTDYASYIQQLPPPDQVDGYFWVVGGTGTGAALRAFEQTYGRLDPKKHSGNLFLAFLGNFKEVAPRLMGAYIGGFGTGLCFGLATGSSGGFSP